MPPESSSPPMLALLLGSRIHRTWASRLDASYVAASLKHTPARLPVLSVPRFRPSEVRPALMVLYRKYMPRVARHGLRVTDKRGLDTSDEDPTSPWRHTRPKGRPRQSGLKTKQAQKCWTQSPYDFVGTKHSPAGFPSSLRLSGLKFGRWALTPASEKRER